MWYLFIFYFRLYILISNDSHWSFGSKYPWNPSVQYPWIYFKVLLNHPCFLVLPFAAVAVADAVVVVAAALVPDKAAAVPTAGAAAAQTGFLSINSWRIFQKKNSIKKNYIIYEFSAKFFEIGTENKTFSDV